MNKSTFGKLFTVTTWGESHGKGIGVVVDGVSDVLTLEPSQLRPVPALDSNFDPEHLLAIGSVDERMLILLDIEKFLSDTVLGESTVGAH